MGYFQVVKGKKVLIACGGEPTVPDIPGKDLLDIVCYLELNEVVRATGLGLGLGLGFS